MATDETIPTDVLIVDDDPQMCAMMHRALTDYGLTFVTTTDPQQAKELLATQRFAAMVTDISMPSISGLDLLSYVKKVTPDCKVLLITGFSNPERIAEALSRGAYDYIRKPFDINWLVETIHKAVSDDLSIGNLPAKAAGAMELEFQLKQAALDSILALVHAVEAKDPYTRRHSEHVAHYAIHIARHMGLSDSMTESVRIAALVHDIGKIGVPDEILTKPGRLTKDEFEYIRRHPALGADILRDIRLFAYQALFVRYHHEKWDGTGYPEGLTGEEIPWGARLLNIADSMDAMLMVRTYKPGYPLRKMLDELARCAGSQFDHQFAAAAIEWCQEHPDDLILAERPDPTKYQAMRKQVLTLQSEIILQE